ncbi:hypothetical protein [Paucisalibacillus sp. EB02]|uniref:hypothetical protein n=1 Tax=Paucisalibacillus sp. EB02 TaxID=1347087 RepID=UPI0004BA304C|nr:hypothetical protein [Paucisalibacillus sp. EB02]
MLTCSNCGTKQNTGKFCEECGGALQIEQASATIATSNQTNEATQGSQQSAASTAVNSAQSSKQTQETVEAIKGGLSHYWSYLLELIKNPTTAFQTGNSNFVNGLVTIILFTITYSLSLYWLANSFYKQAFGGFLEESLPFFAINARLVFGILIMFAITLGSVFAVTKLAKHQDGFKTVLAQFSGLVAPLLAVNLIAIIGGLTSSVELTIYPLVLSNILAFVIIPVLFVYEKSAQVNSKGQKVYHSFLVLLMITVVTYIISSSLLSGTLEELEEIMYYL